jgi:L-glyceraldehyde 3-phosphate reductase
MICGPDHTGNLGSRKYLLASLDQSLKRMGLEYVDIFYSHRPDPDTPLEETMGALARAVHGGKGSLCGHFQLSPELAGQAFRILKSTGVPCLIHQPKYSMFNRWVEDGAANLLENEGSDA